MTSETVPGTKAGEGFLDQLRRVNTERYNAWVGDGQDAGILFDAAELGGEVGELLNVVKKLEREDRGWRGSRAAPGDFEDECADVLICLDKLARRRGVDLTAATVRKFNATSEKQGFPHQLTPPTVAGGEQVERLRVEIERQCSIGAGYFMIDDGFGQSGLWQVNADLDPRGLAEALASLPPAASIPAPAADAEVRERSGVLEALETALHQYLEPMSTLNGHELGERLAYDVGEIMRHARARDAILAASLKAPAVAIDE